MFRNETNIIPFVREKSQSSAGARDLGHRGVLQGVVQPAHPFANAALF